MTNSYIFVHFPSFSFLSLYSEKNFGFFLLLIVDQTRNHNQFYKPARTISVHTYFTFLHENILYEIFHVYRIHPSKHRLVSTVVVHTFIFDTKPPFPPSCNAYPKQMTRDEKSINSSSSFIIYFRFVLPVPASVMRYDISRKHQDAWSQ